MIDNTLEATEIEKYFSPEYWEGDEEEDSYYRLQLAVNGADIFRMLYQS